jgi:hypothetical protein
MAHEQPPNQEFSEREQRLIALLREKGPEDSETRKMFGAWSLEEEAKVMAENTSRADIAHQLKMAKFYRAAGGLDSAYEALDHLCQAAWNDGSAQDLYEEAIRLARSIEVERGDKLVFG